MLDEIKTKAEQLYQVRTKINELEDGIKEQTKTLKTERDELQAQLIDQMNKAELASIKVSSGESYAKATRKGVAVSNEASALKWAKENSAVSIDRRLVAQKLKDAKKLPAGFEAVESVYISVRKPKE